MALPGKSNIRSELGFRVRGAASWLGSWVSPRRAAAELAGSFLAAPPRRRASEAEAALFASAERLRLEHEGETLVVHRFAAGAGPKVLLLHGHGGNATQLAALVAPLVAAGFEVLALDAPGHGESSGSWLAIPQYGAAIGRAAEQLGPVYGVVAHSLGAPGATFAMMLGMRVERAVYIGPPADAFKYFVLWAHARKLPAHIVGRVKREAEERAGYSLERLNAERMGDYVRAPLLVIHDRDDREIAHHDGERVAHATPGGRLLSTRGLGHRRILRDEAVVHAAVEFMGRAGERARVA